MTLLSKLTYISITVTEHITKIHFFHYFFPDEDDDELPAPPPEVAKAKVEETLLDLKSQPDNLLN